MIGFLVAVGLTILVIIFVLYVNNRNHIKHTPNEEKSEIEYSNDLNNVDDIDTTTEGLIVEVIQAEEEVSTKNINPKRLQQRDESKDILDGVDVDKYIEDIARKLLYSENGYGDYTADYLKDIDLNEKDLLFEEAARLIVIYQSGSTSFIQRKFSIGYNRAGRIIDQLEKAGIVGTAQGSVPREVYITDEYSLGLKLATIENETFIESFYDDIVGAIEERYYEEIQIRKEYFLNNYKQEEEMERLQKIDAEKEAIRKKLLEKERKKQLEKEIRQDLIDEGLIEE